MADITVPAPVHSHASVSLAGVLYVAMWGGILALFYLVTGFLISNTLLQNKVSAIARHEARISPNKTESGTTEAERTPPTGFENAVPVDVRVGMYIDRVTELSIADSLWGVDFYVWFIWKYASINPHETFQIVDGHIESKEKVTDELRGDGARYVLYRVSAVIDKSFDVSRFPADDHLLTLAMEDTKLQSYQMRYVPDLLSSNINTRISVPGYEVYNSGMVVKPHSYKTGRGDAHLPPDFKATYSQLLYGIWIHRPNLQSYVKLLLGLFASVIIALIALFVKPTETFPRFGLPLAGFLGAMANKFVVISFLFQSHVMTMLDWVNGMGMVTILLILVESAISLHVFHRLGNEKLSALFDRVSFGVIVAGYVLLNLAFPLVARL